ncbi:MAG: hypothetical protein LW809_00350 [Vampirovibrionales bacterium]|nr:hypothetical protein [Vampirovibrionales bacterium]
MGAIFPSSTMNPFLLNGYGAGLYGGAGPGIMDPLSVSGYGGGMMNPMMMGGYGMGGLYGGGLGYGMGGLYGGMFGYGDRFTANLFNGGGFVYPVPPTPTPPILQEPADVAYHDSCLNGLWGSLHETMPFIPPPKGWRNRMLPEAPGNYESNYWA